MFNPGQPNWIKPVGYDVPYQRTVDLEWFTGVLLLSGYRPYRLTPEFELMRPVIVWAKPVVAVTGWRRVSTTRQERVWDERVEWKDVPQIEYLPPDLSRIARGRVEAVPGMKLTEDAYIILVDGEDGEYTNYVNWQRRGELLAAQ